MDKNKLNISNIEAYLDSLLGNKVSANVFFDTLPPVIKDSWKDLLLVDCSYLIRDFSAYGFGTIAIWLYAKPMSSGAKNVPVLSKMETTLNEILFSNENPAYQLIRRGTRSGYDSNAKLYYNIVEIQILTA